jgi:acyl-CoA dehydrogenase
MTDHNTFRQATRDWLEANCPATMRHPYRNEADACWGGRNCKFQSDDQKNWLERMAAKGWTVPTWPVEYGGAGSAAGKLRHFNARPAAAEIRQRGTETATPAANRPW